MGTAYTELDTTGANWQTDITNAILASTDWSRPNAGGKPGLFQATTTRGAQMNVDIIDAALTLNTAQFGVYRTHDGTTGVDKITRYVPYKRQSGGALATNPIHCVVSAGKEHLFISMEGPRQGEAGTDSNNYGSEKTFFFLNDLNPYFDNTIDKAPAVVCGGWWASDASGSIANNSHRVAISRNHANTASWVQGRLQTLEFPHLYDNSNAISVNRMGLDGSYYLAPWVVFGDSSGMRGRLNSIFYAGMTNTDTYDAPVPAVGSVVTYGSAKYKLLTAYKTDASFTTWNCFGSVANQGGNVQMRSTVIAVPFT